MIEIIAELSVNWNGSMSILERMVADAKLAGASTVKFQAFTKEHVPSNLTLVNSAVTEKNVSEVKGICEDMEIPWFCTPFYPEAVDFLEKADVSKYKIRQKDAAVLINEEGSASAVVPSPLIQKVMATNKPVYMSVIRKPLDQHWMYHPRIRWLYNLPRYPAPIEDVQLWKCRLNYGLSCHSPNTMVPVAAAVMMQAGGKAHQSKVIELHVSEEPKSEYIDGNISFNFEELAYIARCIRTIEKEDLDGP